MHGSLRDNGHSRLYIRGDQKFYWKRGLCQCGYGEFRPVPWGCSGYAIMHERNIKMHPFIYKGNKSKRSSALIPVDNIYMSSTATVCINWMHTQLLRVQTSKVLWAHRVEQSATWYHLHMKIVYHWVYTFFQAEVKTYFFRSLTDHNSGAAVAGFVIWAHPIYTFRLTYLLAYFEEPPCVVSLVPPL